MKNQTHQTPPTLHTHEEAVIYFISQMDIEMLYDILDDNRTYQDLPKWEFLAKLENVFEKFRAAGDTRLLIFSGRCNGCDCDNFKKGGYKFYGNHTKNHFNLIVELTDKEHVTDMFECFNFKTTFQPKFRAGSRFHIDDGLDLF
jgi:hypothetical protein